MVETHTISAPEETWEQVFTYAKQKQTNVSEITRQAWTAYFEETKTYRNIDVVIILLLLGIFITTLLGVWMI